MEQMDNKGIRGQWKVKFKDVKEWDSAIGLLQL